jgi:hypothetical protein
MSKGREILNHLKEKGAEYKVEIFTKPSLSVVKPLALALTAVLSMSGAANAADKGAPVNDFDSIAKAVISNVTDNRDVDINIYDKNNPAKDLTRMKEPLSASLITKEGKEVCNIYMGGIDDTVTSFYGTTSEAVQKTPHIGKAIEKFIVAHEAMHCIQGLSVNTNRTLKSEIESVNLSSFIKSQPHGSNQSHAIKLVKSTFTSMKESYADVGALLFLKAELSDKKDSLTPAQFKEEHHALNMLAQGVFEARSFHAYHDHEHNTSAVVKKALTEIASTEALHYSQVGDKTVELLKPNAMDIYAEVASNIFNAINISPKQTSSFAGNTSYMSDALMRANIPSNMDIDATQDYDDFYRPN